MSQPTEPTGPKTKRVSASNVGLLAAAEMIDTLNGLPDDATRRRVLGWVNDEFFHVTCPEPKE